MEGPFHLSLGESREGPEHKENTGTGRNRRKKWHNRKDANHKIFLSGCWGLRQGKKVGAAHIVIDRSRKKGRTLTVELLISENRYSETDLFYNFMAVGRIQGRGGGETASEGLPHGETRHRRCSSGRRKGIVFY